LFRHAYSLSKNIRCRSASVGCVGERGGDRDSGAAGIDEGEIAVEGFTANVAESQLNDSVWKPDGGNAGEFADLFALRFEEGAGCGECAFEAKGGEGAMDVAAGADALDYLLAEIAAFGEVECAGLAGGGGGLLRELFVADVGAVEGSAFENSEVFEGLRRNRGGSSPVEGVAQSSDGSGAGPELEARDERTVGVEDGNFFVAPGERLLLELDEVRDRDAELGQHGWRGGASDEKAGARGRYVRELDVVHDDEAIEEGCEVGELFGSGFEEQEFGFGEDVRVTLNAALRAEHEVVVAMSGLKILDGVGNHSVEPADSVFAGNSEPTDVIEKRGACGVEECGEWESSEIAVYSGPNFGLDFGLGN
jgi:hypothetical protein